MDSIASSGTGKTRPVGIVSACSARPRVGQCNRGISLMTENINDGVPGCLHCFRRIHTDDSEDNKGFEAAVVIAAIAYHTGNLARN